MSLATANFRQRRVRPGTVRAGQTLSVEVWDGKVTALNVDQRTYRSFVAQPAPWWLIPAGLVLTGLGVLMMATGTAGTYATPRRRHRVGPGEPGEPA